MTREIDFYSTSEEYGWLSNFHRARQVVLDTEYPTNEHFYQSMKCAIDDDAEMIRLAGTPSEAKRLGQLVLRRPDWDEVRVGFMLLGLLAKFQQNPDLRERLLATGDATLHEDSPTDLFWGKKGQDMLGRLLMQVREELQ